MRILFLSHYFPPEVNAPATRTFENCREWARRGHEVHVVTGFPSHPVGRVYSGYARSWYRREVSDGIHVHRVWTHLAANRGFFRRTLNYLSYLPAAVWRSIRLGRFDVIVATSPHFFNAVAGWVASLAKRTPWVYEVRDLWPESIAAVGVLKTSRSLGAVGRFAQFLYRRAASVVCVTGPFIEHLERLGVEPEKLVYVPNGVYPEDWEQQDSGFPWRRELGLGADQVLVSYAGTLGLAHGLESVLEAADLLGRDRTEVRLVLAGDGARRKDLEAMARNRGIQNLRFAGLVPRARVRDLITSSDICLVVLRDAPLFETVLPSKMFEAMASGRPVVLGVAGEARRVLEESGGGIAVAPEDAEALAEAVSRLALDSELREEMGASGRAYVREHFNRHKWALTYLDVLEACVRSRGRADAER